MSDTHGNTKMMLQAADAMTSTHGATLIFHLGDDYADGEMLSALGYDARIIPGLWCAEYRSKRVPATLLEDIDGLRVGCAHAEQDLGERELGADVVMCGHTHVGVIQPRDGRVHLNPGHLKSPRDRGQDPSYALIETAPDTISISILELSGIVRERAEWPRAWFASQR